MASDDERVGPLATLRKLLALERDVLTLSVAMFAFSLGFQMTGRYMPRYLSVLGASSVLIGLYGSFGNLIGAIYPYPGGTFSDRVGSRTSLTLFGLLSTAGFVVWLAAPELEALLAVPAWVWIFVGLLAVQAWKSFGLGATFAVVKQSVEPDRLATGFASTETFRRVAFLLGPLLAAGLVASYGFEAGFRATLAVAAGFGLLGTSAQHVLYDASGDSLGKSFAGIDQMSADLRGMPETLRPLLVGDTLVRFANGMVYVFFVIVVTEFLQVDATIAGTYLGSDALFGVLLGVEMVVALAVMVPAAQVARRVGLKPVVATGFAVYALFPILLVSAPANALVVGLLFAFSGLRFAGLPAHKALIVGPAEKDQSGRVVGSYYLLRNAIVIPSAAVGGWLYSIEPVIAFGVATVIGLLGTGYFLVFGKELDAYA